MRHSFLDIALTVALGVVALLLALNLSVAVEPVQAAPPEVDECEPIGKVGSETLYFCESDYADCVWDPSPALGAGVMDCD